MQNTPWRKCSNCKNPIALKSRYWVCNVSTCNQKRTGLIFCSVDCWDAHLPIARHKDAWAEERLSPSTPEAEAPTAAPKRIDMSARKDPAQVSDLKAAPPEEILVVTSKVKAYIRARSGLNTSASLMDVLSDRIRALCDEAIQSAIKNERKTVLDRDL